MFRWIIRLLGGSGKQRTTSTSTSGASRQDWTWERVDEYPYDHYTEAVEDIKQLKRDRRHGEAIDLLEWCVDFTEAEAEANEPISGAPAPAYYRHLGIVLRKEERYEDEVAVLERYISWFDEQGGSPRQDLVDRLERASELAAKD